MATLRPGRQRTAKSAQRCDRSAFDPTVRGLVATAVFQQSGEKRQSRASQRYNDNLAMLKRQHRSRRMVEEPADHQAAYSAVGCIHAAKPRNLRAVRAARLAGAEATLRQAWACQGADLWSTRQCSWHRRREIAVTREIQRCSHQLRASD